MASLPARLNDQELALVELVASSPLPALRQASARFFDTCMRSLSIMPRKADDHVTAVLRDELYARKLAQHPRDALSFMVSEALDTCDWFPTIKQCTEILARWSRNDEALAVQREAELRGRRERQLRHDETMDALSRGDLDQDEIDAMSRRTKLIAAEHCYLWHDGDGGFRSRVIKPSAEIVSLDQHRAAANG